MILTRRQGCDSSDLGLFGLSMVTKIRNTSIVKLHNDIEEIKLKESEILGVNGVRTH